MSYETEDKMVSHPDHYKSGKYEVIDIIDEFCKDLVGPECVCTANALKYILRWKKKNGIQDVKKAIWYLTHLVEHLDDEEREDHARFDEWFVGKKGIDDEPEPLNLRKNAAGVYIPEDTTKVTSAQVMYASKVITKYCNSMNSCDNCPFFDPDSNGVSCKFRLNSPNAWCICAKEENDIMNPPYDQLLSDFKEAKERLAAYEDDRRIKARSAKALEEENSNLKFDLSEIASIMLKFLAQTDMKLSGYAVGDTKRKEIIDISHECRDIGKEIHKYLAKYEMDD